MHRKLRYGFSLLLVIAVLLNLSLGNVPGITAAPLQEKNVIVVFKDKSDKATVAQAKGKIKAEHPYAKAVAATLPDNEIPKLRKHPNVAAIEEDILIQAEAQTVDWGINTVKAPASWSSGYTGYGVKVAVIDTGIAPHPDLVIAGGVSKVAYTTSYSDDNGHGTHVAGIIGARDNTWGTVGIANNASLYAVKALNNTGSGYLSDIIAGIEWSILNKMDIVNLSLGTTTYSLALENAVNSAYSNGLLLVGAAGNNGTVDGSGDTINYPARFAAVIAVGATTETNQRASFSATGNTLEVAAPGTNILSTANNGSYVTKSGTSMATPYVAGNLALLKQANPTFNTVQLRSLLQKNVLDLGTAGLDSFFGYGLIQAPSLAAPVSPATVTTVATSKGSYKLGETVFITVKVRDGNGAPISGASVSVKITNSKSSTANFSTAVVTDASGNALISYLPPRTKALYTVDAQTTHTGFTSSKASTTFQVK